jgi:hypothetical protein
MAGQSKGLASHAGLCRPPAAACEAWDRGEHNFPQDFGLGRMEDSCQGPVCAKGNGVIERTWITSTRAQRHDI